MMARSPFGESSVVVTALATNLMWSTASVIGWLDQIALTEMVGGAGIEPAVLESNWFTANLYTL